MKKLFPLFLVALSLGLMGQESCFQAPGDGYPNPDGFGLSGHGLPLSYTDNGDGTFTDDITGFMWEKKDQSGGVHDVDNEYTWSSTGIAPDGTLFTDFLHKSNNTCRDDAIQSCTVHGDQSCADAGVGGPCGFAGFRDWCIPNVKALQSLVDYSKFNPSASVPGLALNFTAPFWSSTPELDRTERAWAVNFYRGFVDSYFKIDRRHARAVRPCE